MPLADDIKERLDIVDVVSGYVPSLRRSGRNFAAPCPFHNERTPSFYVFPDRQSWRCFGACATGGDLLSFVMRMEKLDFADALRLLAQRAGVSLSQAKRDDPQRDILYHINDAACALFQETLRSPQGIAARAYLQGRGIDAEASRRFQLGLSPGQGLALTQHLMALGFTQEQVVEAGVATRGEDRPSRDMFLSRLMIPIHDSQGNLAGFGGRSLDNTEPKYLNSPRTPVFDKGNILYLFHKAKKTIREQGEGVIVEGYMDAIAAHQHGYQNVVASMGTSLTQQQVALLKGAAKRFVMALDADAAGQQATFRSLRDSWLALQGNSDVSLRVLVLPFGKDPDELIRNSPEAWRKAASEATPVLDYLFTVAPHVWDLSTGVGKKAAWEEMKPIVFQQGNVFDQDTYFRKVANLLDTTLERLQVQSDSGVPSPRGQSPRRSPSAEGRSRTLPSASTAVFEQERHDPLEEHFLAMLLRWPELRGRVQELDPQCLTAWEDRTIFTDWFRRSTIEELTEALQGELRPRAAYLLSLALPPMDLHQREQAVVDCFHRLEERRLRSLKQDEALLLAHAAEEEGQSRTLEELSAHAIDTNQRLKRLFHTRSEQHRPGR